MSIVKAMRRSVIALCLAAAVFSLLVPLKAEAGATGLIENVAVSLSIPPVVAGEAGSPKATVTTEGCYIGSVNWYNSQGRRLEPDEKFTYDNVSVSITVNASPGYYFAGYVQAGIGGLAASSSVQGSQLTITKTFSPVIWAPDVYKDPGDEKVAEGGMVSFVSYAAFAETSEWIITDTDGKQYTLEMLAEAFPSLLFEPSFNKLNLGPITADYHGFKVRCRFTGPGGVVDSKDARIIVKGVETSSGDKGQPAEPEHEHKYSSQLSSDAGYHWYACECGDALMKEEHDFDWIQVTPADIDSPGLIEAECRVCGYAISVNTRMDPEAVEIIKAEQEAEAAAEAARQAEEENKGFFAKLFELFKPKDEEETAPETE